MNADALFRCLLILLLGLAFISMGMDRHSRSVLAGSTPGPLERWLYMGIGYAFLGTSLLLAIRFSSELYVALVAWTGGLSVGILAWTAVLSYIRYVRFAVLMVMVLALGLSL